LIDAVRTVTDLVRAREPERLVERPLPRARPIFRAIGICKAADDGEAFLQLRVINGK
jgi:hypothetical protein